VMLRRDDERVKKSNKILNHGNVDERNNPRKTSESNWKETKSNFQLDNSKENMSHGNSRSEFENIYRK
jgi:hypothetical protein